jgi:Secretion system C-terminal sorting domain/Kelch motif
MKKALLFCCIFTQTILFGQWKLVTDQMVPSFFCNSVAYEGKMYIMGGPKTSNLGGALDLQLYIFDYATETMTIAPGTLSAPRYSAGIIAHNGKVYCAGGTKVSAGAFISFDIIDVYDIATQTWSTKKLSKPRDGFNPVILNEKIIFAGGYSGVLPSDVVDIYTPATDTWEVQKLSIARAECRAIVANGKAYFCGGTTNFSPYVASSRIDIYDPSQPSGSQWTTAALSQSRVAPVAVAFGDTVMIAGGFSASVSGSNRIDIINTQTGLLSQGTLSEGRAYPTAALMGKKAYFCGGGNYNQSTFFFNVSYAVVDVFDTETKTWSTQALNQNRMAHASSAWGNKIAVAAGWRASANATIGTIEILTENAVPVEIVSLETLGFSISPNPATNYLNLHWLRTDSPADISEIAIVDAKGMTIWRDAGLENAPFTGKTIELTSFIPGQYFLTISSKNRSKRSSTAFVVQK